MTRRRFSATALMDRLVQYNGKCADCGCKTGGANGLEWDHIVPLAIGGEDELDNLQPLCKGCHRAKTKVDKGRIAKTKRQRQRAAGIPKTTRRKLPGSKDGKWKIKLNGEVVER